jgi:hypothetical protein
MPFAIIVILEPTHAFRKSEILASFEVRALRAAISCTFRIGMPQALSIVVIGVNLPG